MAVSIKGRSATLRCSEKKRLGIPVSIAKPLQLLSGPRGLMDYDTRDAVTGEI